MNQNEQRRVIVVYTGTEPAKVISLMFVQEESLWMACANCDAACGTMGIKRRNSKPFREGTMSRTLTGLDWFMIAFWVVGTSLFGMYFMRYVGTTRDYLLAGRRLNWWQGSLAHAGDAVDATDFIAAAGQGYRIGLANLGYLWYGPSIGFLLMSRWIVPLLYRSGVYTNAEFLELRYNPAMRVASAVFQTFYRFVAMALMVYSMAIMFQVILGVDLWKAIWAAMLLTMLYVFLSGQLGVAMAAIPQVGLMIVTTSIMFGYVWADLGGWTGLVEGIGPHQQQKVFHMAGFTEAGIPGGVYLWGMILTLVTYPIINQTVAQRIVSTRSEVDARRGCLGNLPIWYLLTGMSCVIGFAGMVLLPEMDSVSADTIFPVSMQRYLPPGILGATMAAVMLASMSTGAGIGTAIAGLFTVDIYGRFFRREASDRHYLVLSRVVATLVIFVGTCFAMWVPKFGGLIPFYVAFTGSLFLPLTVPYLGAAFFKGASRWSGLAATVGGALVGTLFFLFSPQLPVILGHAQWRPFWAFGAAWLSFFGCSFIENRIKGPLPALELAAALNIYDLGAPGTPETVNRRLQAYLPAAGKTTRFLAAENPGVSKDIPWYAHPTTFELACLIFLVVIMLWWW